MIAVAGLAVASPARAQQTGAAALGELVDGLGTTARVLMIGAHPDDEDTQLIAFLSRGRHIETAYLALTRGDGGQNLIGNELGNALGVIRTEELLAARRIDGGRQYFTRAYDFGFSKNADETLRHWPKDSLLKDVVSVIRAFRPQVIVAVFTGTPRDGHGHHQVSGILAREAFDAAADTVRFPRSTTGGLGPWTPMLFYRGSYFTPAAQANIGFNVGQYDWLEGRTYGEIAAASRSQHLSQGFGILQNKGARMDYLRLDASHVPGAPASFAGMHEQTLFDGVDTTYARFSAVPLPANARAALDSLPGAIARTQRELRLVAQPASVGDLAAVVRLAREVRNAQPCSPAAIPGTMAVPAVAPCGGLAGDLANSINTALDRAMRALVIASGVSVEATAPRELVAVGDTLPVTVAVYNQGAQPIEVVSATLGTDSVSTTVPFDATLPPDSAARRQAVVKFAAPSAPWWLVRPRAGDVFQLAAPGRSVAAQMLAGEDRLNQSRAIVVFRVAGEETAAIVTPIVYRYADPARGELRRPIAAVPAVAVRLEQEQGYARANVPLDRTVTVHLTSGATETRDVRVSLELPKTLAADSATRTVSLPGFGNADVSFRVRGRLTPGEYVIAAVAESDGQRYTTGYTTIDYPHIRPVRMYAPARTNVTAVDLVVPPTLSVAYIPGVSDNVAPMLEQLGIPLHVIAPDAVAKADLSKYSTVVIGPRAFGAYDALAAQAPKINAFAAKGGTVVLQYGQYELTKPGILPYAITLTRPADRVTEEDAPVTVLDPKSPLLTRPNAITATDFAGWVQERASYMPHTHDEHWKSLLSMHDTGEPADDAAILVAPVGKGTYVYTTLSFFRQLPAGNAGAARLFVNLLAADQRAAPAPTRATPLP